MRRTNITKVALFAGGILGTLPPINWRQYLIYAADSGARHAVALGLKPDLLVGDMDSIDPGLRRNLEGVEQLVYPRQKDQTDLELLLLEALELEPQEILVLGAFGGDRPDHHLANFLLLGQRARPGLAVKALAPDAELHFLAGPQVSTITGTKGRIVSLLPLTPVVEEVSLEGFDYPLHKSALFFGQTRGVSNRLSGKQGTIQLMGGRLAVIALNSTRHD